MQSRGLTVIPTISWGQADSYWYCFDGVEQGSVVAVSTLGLKGQKDFFMQGYNEMLRRINPQAIICYCELFPEMKGNVIVVDYAITNNLTSSKMFIPATKFMPSNMAIPWNTLKHSNFSMPSTKFKIIEDNSVYKIGISEIPQSMLEINAPYMLNLNGIDEVVGMSNGVV